MHALIYIILFLCWFRIKIGKWDILLSCCLFSLFTNINIEKSVIFVYTAKLIQWVFFILLFSRFFYEQHWEVAVFKWKLVQQPDMDTTTPGKNKNKKKSFISYAVFVCLLHFDWLLLLLPKSRTGTCYSAESVLNKAPK